MKRSTVPNAIGLAILAGTTVLLFGYSFAETIGRSPVLTVFKAIVVVALGGGIVLEARTWFRRAGGPAPTVAARRSAPAEAALQFAAVLGGAVITFLASVEFSLGAVVASALVGLIGAALLKRLAVPIFCGSFVGMCSPAVFASFLWVALAGALAGVVFVAAGDTFDGFGGKLGTIAFSGALAASLLAGCRLAGSVVPGTEMAVWILGYSIAAAVVTFMISVRLQNGPVVASALVGLAGGLLLPAVHGAELGSTLAVIVFCASFAGMSSPGRLQSVWLVAAAGVICGVVFIYTTPHLGGAGGKLGTIAFGSTIAVHAVTLAMRRLGTRRPL